MCHSHHSIIIIIIIINHLFFFFFPRIFNFLILKIVASQMHRCPSNTLNTSQ